MKYKRLYLLVVLLLVGSFLLQKPFKTTTYFIPFDEAQILDAFTPRDLIHFYQKLCRKKWRTVHRQYRRTIAGKQKRHKKERIPKMIHQIWLEGPIPEWVKKNRESWEKHHPNWEYHLWTKEEIEFLFLQNRTLYDALSCPKAKAELLRFEILYQFGGVFIENTLECVKSLDILHENCDFYSCLTDAIRSPELSSRVIAATPRHPIVSKCIQKIRNKSPENWLKVSCKVLTDSFFKVTKSDSHRNVALPATYFYPRCKSAEKIPSHAFALEN